MTTTGFLILGSVALGQVWGALTATRRKADIHINSDGTLSMKCRACGEPITARLADLPRLSPAEKALVARDRPDTVGLDLVDLPCEACGAAHCLNLRRRTLEFIGLNFYLGQALQSSCRECLRVLGVPPWKPGQFDGNLVAAPGNIAHLGLRCGLCGAVVCVECARTTTRNRTADGSLLCPRCQRGPLDRFWHPKGHPPEAADHTRGRAPHESGRLRDD